MVAKTLDGGKGFFVLGKTGNEHLFSLFTRANVDHLKILVNERYVPYQSLLEIFLKERLDQAL